MDENPFRSPRAGVERPPASKPKTWAEPLRFREVFVIASAMAFMGMAILPAAGAGRYRNIGSGSLESALARLADSEDYLGLMIAVSLLTGALVAFLYKLFGDFRAFRRRTP